MSWRDKTVFGIILGYSYIQNPYWALPFEALECFTNALLLTAFLTYATKLSTLSTIVSVQGLMAGLHFGLGKKPNMVPLKVTFKSQISYLFWYTKLFDRRYYGTEIRYYKLKLFRSFLKRVSTEDHNQITEVEINNFLLIILLSEFQ